MIVECNDKRLNYLLENYIQLYVYYYNEIILPNYKVKLYKKEIYDDELRYIETINHMCRINECYSLNVTINASGNLFSMDLRIFLASSIVVADP